MKNRYLRVYKHIDAISTDIPNNYLTMLAIGYGDDQSDLCYFSLNQWDKAETLCAELNRARGHTVRHDDNELCDCGYPKDHEYKLSCVPF